MRWIQALIVINFLFISGSVFAQTHDTLTVTIPGEEIVITASRTSRYLRDIPASVNLYTEKEIKKTGAKTVDEIISFTPGVDIHRLGGYASTLTGISMRGAGGTGTGNWGVRTLVLVDGVPMNDMYGMIRWNDIPVENIERVEVVRGANSALYGSNAMGGVIQFFTKKVEKKFGISGVMKYGDLNTKESTLNIGGNSGRFGYYLTGGFLKTDGFDTTLPEKRDQYSSSRKQDNKFGCSKLTWDVNDRSQVMLNVKHYDECISRTTTSADRDAQNYDLSFKIRGQKFSETSGLLFYHHDDYVTTYMKKSSEYKNVDHISTTPTDMNGFSFQTSMIPNNSHLFTAGLDYKWGKANNDDLYQDGTIRAQSAGKQRIFSIFIQDEFVLNKRFIFTAGLRYDNIYSFDGFSNTPGAEVPIINYENKTNTSLNPKAGFVYKITKKSNLRGNVGKAFRSPSLFDLYRTWQSSSYLYKSDPLLKPESMISYEVSIDYLFASNFYSKLTLYDNEAKDYIYYMDEAPKIKIRKNISKLRMQGIEFELQKGIGNYFSAFLGYTYNKSKNLEFEGDEQLEGKELPHSPNHKFNIGLNFNNPKILTLNINGKYIGKQYGNDDNSDRLVDYFIINMNLSKRISDNILFVLNIENLENEEYICYRNYLGSPRTASLALRFNY